MDKKIKVSMAGWISFALLLILGITSYISIKNYETGINKNFQKIANGESLINNRNWDQARNYYSGLINDSDIGNSASLKVKFIDQQDLLDKYADKLAPFLASHDNLVRDYQSIEEQMENGHITWKELEDELDRLANQAIETRKLLADVSPPSKYQKFQSDMADLVSLEKSIISKNNSGNKFLFRASCEKDSCDRWFKFGMESDNADFEEYEKSKKELREALSSAKNAENDLKELKSEYKKKYLQLQSPFKINPMIKIDGQNKVISS